MPDEFRIDGHKLMFHPARVAKWLTGEIIYPIYMEISPSGGCNHRCTFCALDYRGYQRRFLGVDVLKKGISEFGRLGVKSIMYAGEGEPLLHRGIAELILHTAQSGIDAALTTNGVFLSEELCKRIIGSISWIKVSIDAGTAETYAGIHGTRPRDFDIVIGNLAAAAAVRKTLRAGCTIGAQMVLLPENRGEVETLAKKVKDAGVDYLVIKPYSQHHESKNRVYNDIDYTLDLNLQEILAPLNDGKFTVIVRTHAMRKAMASKRPYHRCLALPFWSYLDSEGGVWGCSAYLGDERFFYGNIHKNTFEEIWRGDRRSRSMEMAAHRLDPGECRVNCRMDESNRYLGEVINRPAHVNFI